MSHLNQPHFQDVTKARQYLEAVRWPHGPVCPHCGVVDSAYKLAGESTRDGLYKCAECREPFTVTVGTVFERSKIKLNVWLQAVYLLCSSKKGISSHQLHRTLGVTYKTAWFMTHRIREAMKSNPFGLLGGGGKIVEADESYFGTEEGKDKARRRKRGGSAHNAMNKIVALVERDGVVRSIHSADVTGDNLKETLKKNIHPDSHLMTDGSPRYNSMKREQPFAQHSWVNHSRKEYARGIVSTNRVEGYFSIMKRGLIGTYHHVSSRHLQRYLAEFDFRYNNRTALEITDAQRLDTALKGVSGKRLTYKTTHQAA